MILTLIATLGILTFAVVVISAIVEDGKIDRLNEERNRLDALAAKLEEEEKQRMLASLEDPELVSLHELHAPPPDDVMDPFRGSPK